MNTTSFCVLSCFSHAWLCIPTDCSPPGSSVHGILQARILKWVAMPSSRGFSWPRDRTHVSCSFCIAADSLPLSYQGNPWSHSSPQKHTYLLHLEAVCFSEEQSLPPSASVSWHRALCREHGSSAFCPTLWTLWHAWGIRVREQSRNWNCVQLISWIIWTS